MASRKAVKRPPKRFQPKGLTILYEDRDILVVDKESGLLTVSNGTVRENTAYYRLNTYVRKGNQKSRNRVFIVHRLDRDTSGVIVFARSERAKRYLQKEWQRFRKTYVAVVHGTLQEKEGTISSYLAENRAHRVYSVADPQTGKLARTAYRVVREFTRHSLLEVDLLTGRKNQIRVHLAEAGHAVAGDRKYGKRDKSAGRLALHASSITLTHPHTHKEMTFQAKVPPYLESLLSTYTRGKTVKRDRIDDVEAQSAELPGKIDELRRQ